MTYSGAAPRGMSRRARLPNTPTAGRWAVVFREAVDFTRTGSRPKSRGRGYVLASFLAKVLACRHTLAKRGPPPKRASETLRGIHATSGHRSSRRTSAVELCAELRKLTPPTRRVHSKTRKEVAATRHAVGATWRTHGSRCSSPRPKLSIGPSSGPARTRGFAECTANPRCRRPHIKWMRAALPWSTASYDWRSLILYSLHY